MSAALQMCCTVGARAQETTDLATDTAVGNKLPFVPDPGLVSSISIYGMVAG